jgi:hypothetical protein
LSLTFDYIFDFLRECEGKILVPDNNFSINTVQDHRNILECLKKGEGEKCEIEMALHLRKLDEYLMNIENRTVTYGGKLGEISEPIVENINQFRRIP